MKSPRDDPFGDLRVKAASSGQKNAAVVEGNHGGDFKKGCGSPERGD